MYVSELVEWTFGRSDRAYDQRREITQDISAVKRDARCTDADVGRVLTSPKHASAQGERRV
jgi:hypothetical protein